MVHAWQNGKEVESTRLHEVDDSASGCPSRNGFVGQHFTSPTLRCAGKREPVAYLVGPDSRMSDSGAQPRQQAFGISGAKVSQESTVEGLVDLSGVRRSGPMRQSARRDD